MGNTARAIDSHLKKISAWLCRAGAECYSLDQLCVVATSIVLVVPSDVAAHALHLHTKWGHPHCCSLPTDPLCDLPSPACCQRHATACTDGRATRFAARASAPPGVPGLAAPSRHAMRLPRDLCQFAQCPALLFFFPTQLWVSTRGAAEPLHCSPWAALCPLLWQCQRHGCEKAADPMWPQVPQPRGPAGHRSSRKPWPGTPILSHKPGQRIWSNQSETRGLVWVTTKMPSDSCCVGSRRCCVPHGHTVC